MRICLEDEKEEMTDKLFRVTAAEQISKRLNHYIHNAAVDLEQVLRIANGDRQDSHPICNAIWRECVQIGIAILPDQNTKNAASI